MKNIVKIFALGGLDENGKNMYVLEINQDIIVFEAGMKYPDNLSRGVDMIIPDYKYLKDNKKRVKAYFISHGHDDIMGALPYIIQHVPAPVYCSRVTREMIELTAKRRKQKVKFDFREVKAGDIIDINGHETTFFATTHSINESLGVAVETGDGLVVYSSDFILDYEYLQQYRTNLDSFVDLQRKGVLCLMTESVSCHIPGHTSPNHRITPIVEPIFIENTGRIIFSFYSQNLFGIREAIDLAIKYKRRVYIFDDEMKEILDAATGFGTIRIPSYLKADESDLRRPGNEDIVILVTGIGQAVFSYLGRMSEGEDKNVSIKPTDNVVIASPVVPGLETFSTRVIDEVFKTGAKVYNINRQQVVSMHAHAEDIKLLINLVRPKYYLPVKGDYKNLVSNAQIAVSMNLGYNHNNVFVFDNGMVAYFEDGVFKGCSEIIENGEIMIDGLSLGNVESTVISDRQKMADEGVLILGISVDSKNKKIIAGPDPQMRGLIFLRDAEEFVAELVRTFQNLVQEALDNKTVNHDETKVKIREKIISLVRKYTGKDPLVLPVIIDINQK